MSDYPGITTLNLGNTFGAWYAKTNEIITRLNDMQVGGITAGDGILVEKHPSDEGGYTLSIANTVNKNITFVGDVDIQGTLTYAYGGENSISAIAITVPSNAGVTIGHVVFVDSTGLAQRAIANDECTAEAIGVVVGFTGSNAQVAVSGKISGSALVEKFLGITGATLQKGTVYFLSAGVSGSGTTLEPNPIQNVSKPVLIGITSDAGILLPYRGFMGVTSGGFSGSNSFFFGGSGGYTGELITSINGPDSYLYDTQVDFSNGNLRQVGDVITMQTMQVSSYGSQLVWLYGNPQVRSVYDTPPDFIESTITYSGKNPYRATSSRSGSITTQLSQIPKTNIKQYTLYSTSGVTSDVWRLKNIKVHVQDAPNSSFSFAIIRVINRLGNTNFISDASETAEETAGSYALRFGLSEISAINNGNTPSGSASSITGITILSPKTITPSYRYFAGTTYYGDGSTGANLKPSPTGWSTFSGTHTRDFDVVGAEQNATPGSGKYPIIYGRNDHSQACADCSSRALKSLSNRNYTWDFISNVVGNTGAQKIVSEVVKSSVQGTYVDFDNATVGVTLDTSILGWNAYYGAVSEAVYVHIYDTEVTRVASGFGTQTALNNKKTGTIFLEIAKLDINTNTESSTVIIPVNFERDFHEISYIGKDLGFDGKLYP